MCIPVVCLLQKLLQALELAHLQVSFIRVLVADKCAAVGGGGGAESVASVTDGESKGKGRLRLEAAGRRPEGGAGRRIYGGSESRRGVGWSEGRGSRGGGGGGGGGRRRRRRRGQTKCVKSAGGTH